MWSALLLSVALAAEPIRLDAGSLVSPVAEGFARLDGTGSTDERATWKRPPWRILPGMLPDALSADAVMGGTLHLDLPAGHWHAWVMLGREPLAVADVTTAWGLQVDGRPVLTVPAPESWATLLAEGGAMHDPRPTFSRDATLWERQAAAVHTWQEIDLVVGDAGVDIAAVGRPLQALVLADDASVDDVRAQLVAVDDARRTTYLGTVAPADDGQSLAITSGPFAVSPGAWAGPPDPELATTHPILRAVLAPSERRSWLWWMFPGDRPVDVTVHPPPGVDVTVSELTWLDTAGWVDRTRRPRPALIAPVQVRVQGGQGLPVGVVLTLTAREDARPGRQRGYIELLRDGEILPMPLDVELVDVALPPPPVDAGFIVQPLPVAVAIDGRDAASVAGALDADLARMAELGFTAVSFRHLVETRELEADPGKALELARHAFATWATLGGRVAEWGDTSALVRGQAYIDGEPLDDRLATHLTAMLDVASTSPVPVVARAWEEELWKRADAPALAAALLPRIRALLPHGVRLGASMGHPLSAPLAGARFDVVYLGSVPPLTAARVDAARAAGPAVWAYNQPPGRSSAWTAWAAGADAVVQWHWNAPEVDPTADVHAQPERVTAVHLPDGRLAHAPVAEAMSQGVQDVRWLGALHDVAARVLAADRSAAWRQRAQDALDLLDTLAAVTCGVPQTNAHDGETLDPAALDAAIARVRTLTIALSSRARQLR